MKTRRVKKLLFKQEEMHHLEKLVSTCTAGHGHIIRMEYSTGDVFTRRFSEINRDDTSSGRCVGSLSRLDAQKLDGHT